MTSGYEIFFKITDQWQPAGYRGIDPSDSLLAEAEAVMEARKQFFYIIDLISLKILFTSSGCNDIVGVPADVVDPSHFLTITHPQDLRRHHLARARLISMGQEIFVRKYGKWLISFTYRIQHPSGITMNLLQQGIAFYSDSPKDTVYALVVLTEVPEVRCTDEEFHFYSGNKLSLFRCPDDELLSLGNIYSNREFEILRLIEEGMNSEQIARKLFRSVHTIDTHRRNIVRKSGKSTTSEVVIDLKNKGLL